MAVLLSWALFFVWAFVGAAVLRLGRHRWSIPTLLLSPAVGFAAVLVPTYILVRFGVPVRHSAGPLLAALVAASAAVLWRSRPCAARARGLWRQGRAFPAILAASFVLTAWPMFQYGFDWVANGNDDMALYCLSATGYRDHAFASVPTLAELQEGRDATQPLWFFYILYQVRPSELSLSLASAWTGLAAQQVFMPVIVALNLSLVAAASCLTWCGVGRRGAVLTGALLAASSLTTYGVVQQVLGQVGGLALVCASLALVSGRFRHLGAGLIARRACACGLVFAGLLVFYPEVIPVLVGGCVILGLRDLFRGRLDRRHLAHAAAAILVMVALLPVYFYGAASFILAQAGNAGSSQQIVEVFPYYLTPRAPALLWGFLPLAGPESREFQNACLFAAFLFTLPVPVIAAAHGLRGRAFAAAAVAITAMCAGLYATGAAFGLFKLAMFAQPFLWAVVGAWAATRRPRWRPAVAVLLLILVGLNLRVQYQSVDRSRGRDGGVSLPSGGGRCRISGPSSPAVLRRAEWTGLCL